MDHTFHFGEVWASFGDLLQGAWLTIRLSALAMTMGMGVAVCCAVAKGARIAAIRWAVDIYVELIRNTPFLVQIFLIFFGLPSLGLRLAPDTAALIAMIVNVGAYATEIVRAGIESIPRGQIDAGRSLGLSSLRIYRFIVLPPALAVVYPALTSQFILLMLGSSVISAISAQELTAVANDIQSRTFRTIEVYLVVALMYFAMSLAFSAAFAAIGRAAFRAQAAASR